MWMDKDIEERLGFGNSFAPCKWMRSACPLETLCGLYFLYKEENIMENCIIVIEF